MANLNPLIVLCVTRTVSDRSVFNHDTISILTFTGGWRRKRGCSTRPAFLHIRAGTDLLTPPILSSIAGTGYRVVSICKSEFTRDDPAALPRYVRCDSAFSMGVGAASENRERIIFTCAVTWKRFA